MNKIRQHTNAGLSYRLFCMRVIAGSVFLLTLTVAAIICGCSGWTVNGIRAEELRTARGGDLARLAGGMLASMAVHAAGHIAYLEASGKPWHVEGFSEIADGPLDNEQQRWFGRIGFLAQLAGGGLLKLTGQEGYFAAGYHMGTAAEIWSYPALHAAGNSDLRMIDDGGGNGRLEWAAYSIAAGFLLLDRGPATTGGRL